MADDVLEAPENIHNSPIGHYRNVRGLGKSMVVFRLFEKLRYSNERSTIFYNGSSTNITQNREFVWIG